MEQAHIDAGVVTRLCELRGLEVTGQLADDLIEPVRTLLTQAANVEAALRELGAER